MQEIFLGRQPILDRNHDLVAYELLFRSDQTTQAGIADNVSASASVIVNAYAELGIQNMLGKQRGFINVDAELLMSDMLHLLPKSKVVLELLGTMEITAEVVRRCGELRSMGYQLALDDVGEVNDRIKPLLPLVNVVKVDLLQIEAKVLPDIIHSLKPWPLLLLAKKVDSVEQARSCMKLGFHLFQGYHFACPQIISGKRVDLSRVGLMRLLGLIMQDAEAADIEEEFRHHPNMTYNLMRIVNSVASGPPHKIGSLRQGIVVLGRKQLQRWVLLLLYTAGRGSSQLVSPLMQMAATRGKLMELIAIADRPYDRDYHERAFMTGILSLLDTLLSAPLLEILDQLNLLDEVKAALLSREGRLGQLLMLLEKKEGNDTKAVSSILAGLSFLNLGELITAELEAICWANGLDEIYH